MKYKIIKNKDFLSKGTEPVSSIEEGEEIASKLIDVLNDMGNVGLGLSANQIGINKQVAVVNVDGNMVVFMNPKVVTVSKDKLLYTEGCLSIPGKIVTTIRHNSITVDCLNWANQRTFQPSIDEDELKLKNENSSFKLTNIKNKMNRGLLECIIVQHQLCLLDGILITDESVRFNKQIINSVNHGRNDKVMISKDKKTQFIKYKKAEPLLKDGWIIV